VSSLDVMILNRSPRMGHWDRGSDRHVWRQIQSMCDTNWTILMVGSAGRFRNISRSGPLIGSLVQRSDAFCVAFLTRLRVDTSHTSTFLTLQPQRFNAAILSKRTQKRPPIRSSRNYYYLQFSPPTLTHLWDPTFT
jgi:hypothetical protein